MSIINVTNVVCCDNPAKFSAPFRFDITFECAAPGLKEELEWKLVYVGSAENEKFDQELDVTLVGPVGVGRNKFNFECPAPNPDLIPVADLMEVTVLLLTCCYKDKEFIRIGFYVNNDYGDNLELKEKPPVQPDVSRLVRTILADRPRVTRFQIPWDEQAPEVTAALRAASAIEQKSDSAIGRNGSDSSMHTADFDSVVSAGPGSAATPSLVSDAAASLSDSMMDTSV